MFDAQLLQTGDENASVSVFGPWFERLGSNAIFTVDLLSLIHI